MYVIDYSESLIDIQQAQLNEIRKPPIREYVFGSSTGKQKSKATVHIKIKTHENGRKWASRTEEQKTIKHITLSKRFHDLATVNAL